ncbi:tyrosine-type recombinase/integrase [Deinococcus yavapaiensis]|uniref:Phage integrase family protein n=1 Tax=Deinococcus yavapaiensis KR-236 TaxID=694435 RepID=A0A318SL72_9DEIO|nr:tyrosine-type recombinase/integrase [Deinococcus yavapaiensis]PYE53302.1 phage integrase family protein [Deinococcus yavapaiensis KR-236]
MTPPSSPYFFDSGVRASELAALDLTDVKPEGYVVVRHGKGGKSRAVPVERGTIKAIRLYVTTERDEDAPHRTLFLANGEPMARATLDKLLDRLCRLADLPRLSAHAFRRGFGVQYLRNGGDVFTLQRIFGHTSLEMSNRYALLNGDDLKQAHRRASPMRTVNGEG